MSTSKNLDPPSDAELMSYLDGELEEVRSAEVAAHLQDDEDGRAKLRGIEFVAQLLRDQAEQDRRADGVADAVMARIAGLAENEAAAERPAADSPVEEPGAKVIPLPQRAPRRPDAAAPEQAPAPGGARSWVAIALAAAAVAAGLFFFGRSGWHEQPVAERTASAPGTVAAVEPSPARAGTAAQPGAPTVAEADSDDEPAAAVEVAAVDFGAHMGSVFYVSSGHDEAAATTAVIWVTDEAAGD